MTEKEKEELRKIRERQLAIKSDIGGIKDKITTEKRGMTPEESNHVKDLLFFISMILLYKLLSKLKHKQNVLCVPQG